MLTDAILTERERCAKICGDMAAECLRHQERGNSLNAVLALTSAAGIIKSANPPHIQVVRPETAVAAPSKVTQHTIVAGQGLVDDEIVDRFRMQAKNGSMEVR